MLSEVIERWANMKTEVDSYSQQLKEDNAKIKELIVVEGKKVGEDKYTASSGGFTVNYSVKVSRSFDEDKLVEKLKTLAPECIVMKPVVDMEKLEKLLYSGEVAGKDIADCEIIKRTPEIRLVKNKEK